MSPRRNDKFMQKMGRIHRSRQERKAQRRKERQDGNGSHLAEVKDSMEFNAKGFNALGNEVAKGVAKESGRFAVDFLKVGTDIGIDLITMCATLGTVPPQAPLTGRSHRRRRRRRR